ncbi:Rrf2 family transcriptional regulator [Saccharospirillum impatiens]|uniref:Rrf2 family transcriptional regulator n=1 Tax=Saccharospirillum impatiens TaxID=169438 RepID=UPI0004073364|nr:Rrf2 family transcriptional regulator [Saccharospirillum impatiens]
MHITRYSDYALRVLIYLSAEPDRLTTIQAIADSYGISKSHLMKVVNQLNQLGYVSAVRGKNGGLRLGQNPAHINIGVLFRETESDTNLVECFSSDNQCAIAPVCNLKNILNEARNAFLSTLDNYTLADLIQPRNQVDLTRILRIV